MIAVHHRLRAVEDATQGIMTISQGRPLGSTGHVTAFPFRGTKNIIAGEGSAE